MNWFWENQIDQVKYGWNCLAAYICAWSIASFFLHLIYQSNVQVSCNGQYHFCMSMLVAMYALMQTAHPNRFELNWKRIEWNHFKLNQILFMLKRWTYKLNGINSDNESGKWLKKMWLIFYSKRSVVLYVCKSICGFLKKLKQHSCMSVLLVWIIPQNNKSISICVRFYDSFKCFFLLIELGISTKFFIHWGVGSVFNIFYVELELRSIFVFLSTAIWLRPSAYLIWH